MISIVLPTYNGEKYIEKSIQSVLNQTYQDWELIVIDDCSLDSTNSIVQKYVKEDKRVKLYKNSSNLRLPASLNRGFSLAKGEFFTWTSDDNMFKSVALERLVDVLQERPNVGLVFSAMDLIDSEGKVIEHTAYVKETDEIYYNNIVKASFMYTKKAYEIVGDYNVNKFLVEDYDYWLRIVRNFDIEYIDQSLYLYRVHAGSLTQTRNHQMLEAKVDLYKEQLSIREFPEVIRKNIYRELAIAEYSLDRYDDMKVSIEAMKDAGGNVNDLKKKVRIANAIGKDATLTIKNIYRIMKGQKGK